MDGVSYCGARTVTYVGLSSPQHTTLDETIVDFDTVDTFTIDGPLDAHWGHYAVAFGVTLDLYPDFTRQEFSFSLEIVPDCASETISQASAITFAHHYQNFAAISIDFAGVFSFDLEGAYDYYCGALEFHLDPTGIPAAQDYFVYDGATVLTLAPTTSHASGIYSHTLRARIVAYPSAFLDVPITVHILSCTVTGHYAHTLDGLELTPARSNTVTDYNYIIQEVSDEMIVTFTFDDIDTAENDGCQVIYTQEYALFVDGVDVSSSLPAWISSFNPSVGELKVNTDDVTLADAEFTIVIRSAFVGELIRDADTEFQINLRLVVNSCKLTNLTAVSISDMAFTIAQLSVPTIQQFDQIISSVDGCGDFDYTITGDHPYDLVSLDPVSRTIEIWTDNGLHSWTDATSTEGAVYTLSISAALQNFPTVASVSMSFQVKVSSDCFQTLLYNHETTQAQSSYYMKGFPAATEVLVESKDTASSYGSGDGFSLCGVRSYSIAQVLESYTVSDETLQVTDFREVTLSSGRTDSIYTLPVSGTSVKLEVFDDSSPRWSDINVRHVITVTTSLDDYPQV